MSTNAKSTVKHSFNSKMNIRSPYFIKNTYDARINIVFKFAPNMAVKLRNRRVDVTRKWSIGYEHTVPAMTELIYIVYISFTF